MSQGGFPPPRAPFDGQRESHMAIPSHTAPTSRPVDATIPCPPFCRIASNGQHRSRFSRPARRKCAAPGSSRAMFLVVGGFYAFSTELAATYISFELHFAAGPRRHLHWLSVPPGPPPSVDRDRGPLAARNESSGIKARDATTMDDVGRALPGRPPGVMRRRWTYARKVRAPPRLRWS